MGDTRRRKKMSSLLSPQFNPKSSSNAVVLLTIPIIIIVTFPLLNIINTSPFGVDAMSVMEPRSALQEQLVDVVEDEYVPFINMAPNMVPIVAGRAASTKATVKPTTKPKATAKPTTPPKVVIKPGDPSPYNGACDLPDVTCYGTKENLPSWDASSRGSCFVQKECTVVLMVQKVANNQIRWLLYFLSSLKGKKFVRFTFGMTNDEDMFIDTNKGDIKENVLHIHGGYSRDWIGKKPGTISSWLAYREPGQDVDQVVSPSPGNTWEIVGQPKQWVPEGPSKTAAVHDIYEFKSGMKMNYKSYSVDFTQNIKPLLMVWEGQAYGDTLLNRDDVKTTVGQQKYTHSLFKDPTIIGQIGQPGEDKKKGSSSLLWLWILLAIILLLLLLLLIWCCCRKREPDPDDSKSVVERVPHTSTAPSSNHTIPAGSTHTSDASLRSKMTNTSGLSKGSTSLRSNYTETPTGASMANAKSRGSGIKSKSGTSVGKASTSGQIKSKSSSKSGPASSGSLSLGNAGSNSNPTTASKSSAVPESAGYSAWTGGSLSKTPSKQSLVGVPKSRSSSKSSSPSSGGGGSSAPASGSPGSGSGSKSNTSGNYYY